MTSTRCIISLRILILPSPSFKVNIVPERITWARVVQGSQEERRQQWTPSCHQSWRLKSNQKNCLHKRVKPQTVTEAWIWSRGSRVENHLGIFSGDIYPDAYLDIHDAANKMDPESRRAVKGATNHSSTWRRPRENPGEATKNQRSFQPLSRTAKPLLMVLLTSRIKVDHRISVEQTQKDDEQSEIEFLREFRENWQNKKPIRPILSANQTCSKQFKMPTKHWAGQTEFNVVEGLRDIQKTIANQSLRNHTLQNTDTPWTKFCGTASNLPNYFWYRRVKMSLPVNTKSKMETVRKPCRFRIHPTVWNQRKRSRRHHDEWVGKQDGWTWWFI